jgi:hypothetical protein
MQEAWIELHLEKDEIFAKLVSLSTLFIIGSSSWCEAVFSNASTSFNIWLVKGEPGEIIPATVIPLCGNLFYIDIVINL